MNFLARYKKIRDKKTEKTPSGSGFVQEKSGEVKRLSLSFAQDLAQKSEKVLSYFSRPTSRIIPKAIVLLLLALGPVAFQTAHATLLPDVDLIMAKFFNIPIVFSGWILGLAGVVLNTVLDYTVVNMSGNLTQIKGINIAWATIRDLSNMSFIFILLYISISTVLGLSGSQWKKTLGTVVIAAVLLNFSLFMTKVMVDASNIFTLGIYRQIVTDPNTVKGLSDSIMQPLGLTTLYKVLDPKSLVDTAWSKLFIISIGSSAFMLVTAAVFLAVSVMFLIRYITIIFLLILSPIAVMGLLPQFSGTAKKWWNQLVGQLTFAPAYMIMTWVVITIIQSSKFVCPDQLLSDTFTNLAGATAASTGQIGAGACAGGSIGTILNFIIIIGMAIASLTIAKGLSNQSKGAAEKLVGGALGFGAGAAAFGGRKLGGGLGRMAANSEYLKEKEAKGGALGFASRMTLKGGQKAASGSFDVRSSKALGLASSAGIDIGIGGKAGGKGGYDKTLKDAAKAKKDFADSLGPSDIVKDEAQQELDTAKDALDKDPDNAVLQNAVTNKKKRLEQLKGVSKDDAEKENKETIQKRANEAKGAATKKREEAKEAEKEAEAKARAIVVKGPEIEKKKRDLETARAMATNMTMSQAARELAQEKAVLLETDYNELNGQYENNVKQATERYMLGNTTRDEATAAEKEAVRVQSLTEKGNAEKRDAELKKLNQFKEKITSDGDRRKEAYASRISSPIATPEFRIPFTSKTIPSVVIKRTRGRVNRQAAADIRKGGKKAEDLIKDALKATGQLKDEPKEEAPADKPKEEPKP
jgi:hypothetical protein